MRVWILLIIAIGLVSYGSIDKEPEKVIYIEKPIKYVNKHKRVSDNYRILEDSILIPFENHVREITGDTTFDIWSCETSCRRYKDHDSDHSFKPGKCAIDLDMHRTKLPVSNLYLFNFIKHNRNYDQLITHRNLINPNYIHIGFRPNKCRGQILFEYVRRGRVHYKRLN